MTNSTVLRIVITNYFPYSNNDCANAPLFKLRPNCILPGIVNEILGIVADIANFKIEPIVIHNQKYAGVSYTETITAFVPMIKEMMLNGTVDTAAVPLEYSSSLEEEFDISDNVYDQLNFKFYVYDEDFGANWWNMFKVYDSRTWMAMFFFLAIQCFLCALVQVVQRRYLHDNSSLIDKIWQVLSLQLLQSAGPRFRLVSGNLLLLIFALFQCVIILGIFTSYFLSIMVRMDSNSQEMVNSMKSDLLHNRRRLITTTKNEWIKDKNDRYPLIPGMKKKEGTIFFYDNAEEAIAAVLQENAVLVAQEDEYAAYLATMNCEIAKLEVGSPPLTSHFLFMKGFPHLEKLNQALKIGRAKIRRVEERYRVERLNNCTHFKMGDPLRLNSYLGVLLMCGGGLFVGTMFFAFEILARKYKINKI